jgi:PAS domain S-box-containing protein
MEPLDIAAAALYDKDTASLILWRLQDAVLRLDCKGRIVFANLSALKFFGLQNHDKLYNKLLADFVVDELEVNRMVFALTTRGEIVNHEVDFMRRDGQIAHGLVNGCAHHNEQGEFIYEFVLRDITEGQHLKGQVREEQERAEAANLARQQFLSMVSHELRTPLNAVVGLAHLLQQPVSSTALEKITGELLINSNQLLELVSDLLDLSRVDLAGIELKKSPVDLQRLLENLRERFEPLAQSKEVAFQIESSFDKGSMFLVDPLRLEQILNNLVANAVKFTHHGSIKLSMMVDCEGGSNACVMHVTLSDTGIGIAPGRISEIFEAFSQVSSSTTRRYGGSGLGLTITRALIEAHGGEISVVSELNAGSTFTFSIPVEPADLPELHTVERKINLLGEGMNCLLGKRVLVAEDNEVNQLIVARYLEYWGCVVEVGSNGLEAYELAKSREFDVILLDIQMPVMDGFVAARHIRSMGRQLTEIPIIAVTAGYLEEVKPEVEAAGMNDVLLKPYAPETLRQLLLTHAGSPVA